MPVQAVLMNQSPNARPFWGQIDIKEYEIYDYPTNAELHEIVPSKLIAFTTWAGPCSPTTQLE